MNLTKIENGFQIDGQDEKYLFVNDEYEIICETECHIQTDWGKIFFNTSVTIGNQSFELIEDWIKEIH